MNEVSGVVLNEFVSQEGNQEEEGKTGDPFGSRATPD